MDHNPDVWVSPGALADIPADDSAESPADDFAESPAGDEVLGAGSPPGHRFGNGPLVGSPLYRLKPRTVGHLMDGGFDVLRFRPRTLAVVTSAIILPLYGIPLILLSLADPTLVGTSSFGSGFDQFFTDSGQLSSQYWQTLIVGYLSALALMVAQMLLGLGVTYMVTSWMTGHDPQAGEVLRNVARFAPVASGVWILALMPKILGAVACGIGLLVIIPALSLCAPVVAAEHQGVITSLRRAVSLAQRRLGTLIALMLLWMVVSGVLEVASFVGLEFVTLLLPLSEWASTILSQSVEIVVAMVVAVTQVAVTVLAYVDIRYRTEAMDLELQFDEVFPDAAR